MLEKEGGREEPQFRGEMTRVVRGAEKSVISRSKTYLRAYRTKRTKKGAKGGKEGEKGDPSIISGT